MKDNEIQQLNQVINDLLARDLGLINKKPETRDNGDITPTKNNARKEFEKTKSNLDSISENVGFINKKPSPLVFEDMDKEQQKSIKKRARKKVFGRVGTLTERAKRFY